tara:strand:- start:106 stop:312 length:207 start_codon:yes stop_codon:yes gene_type:complete
VKLTDKVNLPDFTPSPSATRAFIQGIDRDMLGVTARSAAVVGRACFGGAASRKSSARHRTDPGPADAS